MTNSNLDKLIAAEREKANKRIAKLRKQAADEQRRRRQGRRTAQGAEVRALRPSGRRGPCCP